MNRWKIGLLVVVVSSPLREQVIESSHFDASSHAIRQGDLVALGEPGYNGCGAVLRSR